MCPLRHVHLLVFSVMVSWLESLDLFNQSDVIYPSL